MRYLMFTIICFQALALAVFVYAAAETLRGIDRLTSVVKRLGG